MGFSPPALVARATTTEYHRLGGLNNRPLAPDSSGDYKSKTKVLVGLVSSEASPCHVDGHLPTVRVCVLISSLCKDVSHTGLGPPNRTSF